MTYPRQIESRAGVYTIYMLRIPQTGKCYIGMTGQEPHKRWSSGSGYLGNDTFFSDIKQFGWESVEKIVVAQIRDFEAAADCENETIVKHKATDPQYGYNLWYSGGNMRPVASVGRNISKAKMGHSVSAEVRARLGEFGCVPVVSLDMNGKIVKRYGSLTEAANDVGAFKTNIWAVCEGRKRSCRGFKWMRERDFNTAKQAELADRTTHGGEE